MKQTNPKTQQTSFPEKVKISVLNRTHAEYDEAIGVWSEIKALYENGPELYANEGNRFLQERPKEPGEIYRMRVQQMFYEPNLATALGYYHATLFKRAPKIDLDSADVDGKPTGKAASAAILSQFEFFMENCDRQKVKLADYARDVFTDLALYRTHYTVIDLPKRDDVATNRLLEEEERLDMPFLTRYEPHQILNWGNDAGGNIQWAVIKTQEIKGGPLEEVEVYDVWYVLDQTSFAIYKHLVKTDNQGPDKEYATRVDDGLHCTAELGAPPIIRWNVKHTMWLGNRARPIAKEHLNQANALSWQMKNSNVSFPIVYSNREVAKMIGSFQFLHLAPEDRFEWSESKGQAIAHSMHRCEQLVEELYRQCHLQVMGRTANATAQSQSGYAKEQEWTPSQEMLEGYGDIMRQFLTATLRAYVAIRKESAAPVVRGYSFGRSNAEAGIQRLILVQEAAIQSDTLHRELQIEAALDLIQDSDQTTKDEIVKEISAAPGAIEQAQAEADAQQKMLEAQLTRMTRESTSSFDKSAVGEGA